MTEPTADTMDMSWYLNRLIEEHPVILNVSLFSGDGLVLATSDGLGRDEADTSAASMCGIASLSTSLSEFCNRPDLTWRRSIIDMDDHCIVCFGAGHNALVALAVAAEMAHPDFAGAVQGAVKAVRSFRHLLSARERT